MMWLALLVVALYAALVLRCWHAWRKLPVLPTTSTAPPVFFTVLIPVRNEALHIVALLQDLELQQYPINLFEVLVIDDHSQDATAALVKQFQTHSQLTLTLVSLTAYPGDRRQKKAAIETGIELAQGTWIACTDGDCRLSPLWLHSFSQMIYDRQPKFISGPVLYHPVQTLWQQVQALEFSALIGMGAASIGLQKPTMCNGANLAYEKDAFLLVNGFAGNEQVPSGDDEFLLHKIHKQFPGQAVFLKEKGAIVQTSPAETMSQFLHQRVRWASKWRHYEGLASRVLAVLVLGANVAVGASVLGAVLWGWPVIWALSVVVLKLGADAALLWSVLGFFGKKKLLWHLFLLQLVYVPYMLVTALLGLKGSYAWKGRQLTTA